MSMTIKAVRFKSTVTDCGSHAIVARRGSGSGMDMSTCALLTRQ